MTMPQDVPVVKAGSSEMSHERFLDLLQTAADPSSSSLRTDELASALGIARLPSKEEAFEVLEKELLAPVRDLSGPELWRWQVQAPINLPFPPLTLSPLPPTHTVTPSFRGIDGTFTHWREALAPRPPAHPALSSLTTRAPAPVQNFVRGKGSYAPFLPGGLDATPVIQDEKEVEDEEEEDEGGWKTRAPRLRRGMKLDGANEFLAEMLGSQSIAPKARRRRRDGGTSPSLEVTRLGDEDAEADGIGMNGHAGPSKKNVDDLLPVGRLPAPPPPRKAFKVAARKEWAHVVDVDKELLNFDELVPKMAREYPFTLDNFQKEAVYRLEMGDSVFVAAHTSAGKTVVAEYAIALAAKHMTRAIYTSPIKALSNQKFRDFKTSFDPSTVGILTGDVQINAEGSCLIMTTEILRSMLYKGADLIRDVEFVIFDEVHYVNDAERGVVWEEVIIMLPEHVNIILLSATVPNTREFADWVGRTKKKDIYVISTPMRPVPLEHYLWAGRDLHRIVDSKSNFLGEGYRSASESLRRKQDKEREAAGLPPVTRTGGRDGPPTGAKDLPTGRGAPFTHIGAGRQHSNRGGGPNGAPRAAPPTRGRGGGFGPPRGGGHHLDQNIWTHLISHLRNKHLLPVVNFVFSKKKCEEYAGTLQNMDLCDAKDKSEVHVTWERALNRLKGSDKTLPQITRMRELLGRGIGVHHGGLLPLVKGLLSLSAQERPTDSSVEVVEILFSRGLVKVLFATETFAMGVNMPAKCVVFSGIRKHDGHSFRNLLPGEYTQMAGRAGRRGLDTTGTVIILSGDELPTAKDLTDMMLGTPNRLASQFRLTYNMILNLLRVEALRVEEMIKRSFSENAAQKLAPEQQRQIAHTEKQLARLPKVNCEICKVDIGAFYDLSAEVVRVNTALVKTASWDPAGGKSFTPGRVVILRNGHFPGNLAVILRSAPILVRDGMRSDSKAFSVLALVTKAQRSGADDLKPKEVTPRWPPVLPKGSIANATWELVAVDATSISFVVNRILKADSTAMIEKKSTEAREKMMNALAVLHEDLASLPEVPEVEWTRMRAVEFQDLLRGRLTLSDRIAKLGCQLCEDFDGHYAALHEIKLVEASLTQLKLALSDQNLELLPDYESRVDVLKRLQFIDDNSTVLLKGRVACEELILTELILENILADYTPEEVVALLSIFVFVEKTDSQPVIPPKLANGLDVIYRIAEDVEREQDRCSVQYDEFREKFKPGLVEVVYEWAKGMPFNQITDLTDVPEGTIVRVITRLDETCREVRDAARVIGDADLFKKMEEAQGLIKRDIVFAASLYL